MDFNLVGSWEFNIISSEVSWSDETKLIHEVPMNYTPNFDDAVSFYAPEEQDKIKHLVQSLLEFEDSFDVECRLVTYLNNEVWVRVTGLVSGRANSEVTKISGTFENITKEKRKLKLLESYFGVLNESSMLTISDTNGFISYVNPKLCELTGFSLDELKGKTHKIFNSGYHEEKFFAGLWNTINSGETWQGDILNRNKDGSLQWIKTSIYPLKDENDVVTEFVSIRVDINKEKLREKEEYEQKKINAISEVGSQILHEVMSPLSVLKSYVKIIDDAYKSGNDQKIKKSISSLQIATHRVVEVFDDMRSLLREEDYFHEVNLNSVIRAEYFNSHLKLQAQEVSFIFDKDENLPTVLAHKGRVGQIVTNLINNSLREVSKLEDKWIRVSFDVDDNFVYLAVSDSGEGISQEISSKIFESLFTTYQHEGGTGLGLAISRRLAKRMKGELYLDNTKENTTFIVKLPRYQEEYSS